jgi:hypothetical protein
VFDEYLLSSPMNGMNGLGWLPFMCTNLEDTIH